MTTIDDVFAALDSGLRKRLFVASEAPHIRYQKTPVPALNRALNGGLPYGRQVLIWGNKSSGKSSMCLQMVGLAQKEGKVCAWIDSEMAFDQSWATKLGVDCSKLILSTARTVNEMTDVGVSLMKAGVDLIVVDSISSLLPAVYFQKDSSELKELDQTQQIGAFSKDMGHAVKMLNYANNQVNETLLVFISQQRNMITPMYTKPKPEGGYAVEFYSSVVVKLFSSETEANALKGFLPSGDKLIERKVGRKVRWELVFSKTSENFQSGEYDFYFAGDNVGVDWLGNTIDQAVEMGYIKQTSKAWYDLEDGTKVHGMSKLIEYFRENEQDFNKILEKVQG